MIKPIVQWPNPGLKHACHPVTGESIAGLIQDLKDTLTASGGEGLAANQIGGTSCVLVVNSYNQGVKVFVNPVITKVFERRLVPEGCLSIPGVVEGVSRGKRIVVKYLTDTNIVMEEEFDGRDAHTLQHECDHLNGIVFIDYLKPAARDAIRVALRRARR